MLITIQQSSFGRALISSLSDINLNHRKGTEIITTRSLRCNKVTNELNELLQNKSKIYFLHRLCLKCYKTLVIFLSPWPYDLLNSIRQILKTLNIKNIGINETSQLTCIRSCETPHDESCDNPRRWIKQHVLKRERRLTIVRFVPF